MDQNRFGALPPRLPDFLCVGAQKAGTTWLHHNLRAHPEVWLPPVKEIHYFNEIYIPGHIAWTGDQRRDKATGALRYHIKSTPEDKWDYRFIACLLNIIENEISDIWYSDIFKIAKTNQICGEITPEYSILPRAGISHVARIAPPAKIIFLLRDPVERAWSHIRMLMERDRNLTVSDAWASQDVRMRSNYPQIISNWKSFFRTNQLFIGFSDEIFDTPIYFLNKICDFLGVPFASKYFRKAEEPVFVGVEREPSAKFLHEMRIYFEPIYRKLAVDFPDPCRRWLEKHFP